MARAAWTALLLASVWGRAAQAGAPFDLGWSEDQRIREWAGPIVLLRVVGVSSLPPTNRGVLRVRVEVERVLRGSARVGEASAVWGHRGRADCDTVSPEGECAAWPDRPYDGAVPRVGERDIVFVFKPSPQELLVDSDHLHPYSDAELARFERNFERADLLRRLGKPDRDFDPCWRRALSLCPTSCSRWKTCAGTVVCTEPPIHEDASETCGKAGSYNPSKPCCPGLERRCGWPESDGRCQDSSGAARHRADGPTDFGLCLPCGNGRCDPLENACNCPQDCGPAKRPAP
jgi:hypothetical protein